MFLASRTGLQPRHALPLFYVPKFFQGMSVGVNGEHESFFHGIVYPSPVNIKTVRRCIDFNNYIVLYASIDDGFVINRVTLSPQQQPAGHVPEDHCIRVVDGA